MSENDYTLFGTYAQSKLANVLFTTELQKRINKTINTTTTTTTTINKKKREKEIMVVAHCVHPGCVRTEVTRNMSSVVQFGNNMAAPFMKWLQKTPQEGCFSSVHAATSPEAVTLNIDNKTRGGRYYFHCEEVQKGVAVNDVDAKKLWEISEAYVEAKFL